MLDDRDVALPEPPDAMRAASTFSASAFAALAAAFAALAAAFSAAVRFSIRRTSSSWPPSVVAGGGRAA